MIIDTTEVQAINSFSRLESLKEVYGIIWVLIPIFTPILGITIGVLVIVWLEREISAGISLVHKSKHQSNQRYRNPKNVAKNHFDESIPRHKTLNRDKNNSDLLVPEKILSSRRRRELRILISFNLKNQKTITLIESMNTFHLISSTIDKNSEVKFHLK
ncbi:hypothetical protein R6Q59_003679 [Mikania micrantha]